MNSQSLESKNHVLEKTESLKSQVMLVVKNLPAIAGDTEM